MIEWDDKFSVLNDEIDEQHKKLILIIEKVATIVSQKNFELSKVLEVVDELDNYVDEHFSSEEALMVKYDYPYMDFQLKEHDKLRKKLEELNVFNHENDPKFFNEMLHYLIDWLLDHILKTDKKLGLYIKSL